MYTLGSFSNCSLLNIHFCLRVNGGIVNLTNQVFLIVFLIASMSTTLLLSFFWSMTKGGLSFLLVSVANQCCFSQTAHSPWPVFYSNLIAFSFKLPVSSQYQQDSSGFREPSIHRANCGV